MSKWAVFCGTSREPDEEFDTEAEAEEYVEEIYEKS